MLTDQTGMCFISIRKWNSISWGHFQWIFLFDEKYMIFFWNCKLDLQISSPCIWLRFMGYMKTHTAYHKHKCTCTLRAIVQINRKESKYFGLSMNQFISIYRIFSVNHIHFCWSLVVFNRLEFLSIECWRSGIFSA